MTPVALYSPEPAGGWLPWIWLAPIAMVLFNAGPMVALDGWRQLRLWSTPRGDPIGLAGLHALLWIGFVLPPLAVPMRSVSFTTKPLTRNHAIQVRRFGSRCSEPRRVSRIAAASAS